ncbi:MAG TPA: hypothetical protein VGO49_22560 [Bradyrhizobium sp.]|jgi:hypothetical protein|nr:hypothetical protein [Bradyrhizobium sp.]
MIEQKKPPPVREAAFLFAQCIGAPKCFSHGWRQLAAVLNRVPDIADYITRSACKPWEHFDA